MCDSRQTKRISSNSPTTPTSTGVTVCLYKKNNDDKGAVLAACETDGLRALSCASRRLQDDKEVVLAACRQNGSAFAYASNRLKDDKEVGLVACQTNGFGALEKASPRLKDDKDILLLACQQDGYGLQFASSRLKDDKEVVLTACKQDGKASLAFASEKLKDDEEVVLAACRQNRYAIQFASARLRNSTSFIREIKLNSYLHKSALLLQAIQTTENIHVLTEQIRQFCNGYQISEQKYKPNRYIYPDDNDNTICQLSCFHYCMQLRPDILLNQ